MPRPKLGQMRPSPTPPSLSLLSSYRQNIESIHKKALSSIPGEDEPAKAAKAKLTAVIQDIMLAYSDLRANIRRRNSHATWLFSSILPHSDDFPTLNILITGLNFAMENGVPNQKGRLSTYLRTSGSCRGGGSP